MKKVPTRLKVVRGCHTARETPAKTSIIAEIFCVKKSAAAGLLISHFSLVLVLFHHTTSLHSTHDDNPQAPLSALAAVA